jgi:CHAT domain-containing protein/tetratricopeptide (TPR) repeat protein
MRPPQPLFLLTLLVSCLFLRCPSLPAQSQNAATSQATASGQAATPLSPIEHQRGKLQLGKPIEQQLKGEEADIYTVKVKKRQFLHVVVLQEGIDVVVTLLEPNGTKIVEADSPNGAWGPEQASLVARVSGSYSVSVSSQDKSTPVGRYQAKVTDLRKSNSSDQTRIDAERKSFEAVQLLGQNSADAARKSLQALKEALTLWQTVGDRYEEALTLSTIGIADGNGKDYEKALDDWNRALSLWNALGEIAWQARSLNNLGLTYYRMEQNATAVEFYVRALPLWQAAGNRPGEAAALESIADVYDHMGRPRDALESSSRAIDLWRLLGKKQSQAAVLNARAALYRELGENQKAMDDLNSASILENLVHDRRDESVTLENLALLYLAKGLETETLDYYGQALQAYREVGNANGEAQVLTGIGLVYSNFGDRQKALGYFDQSLAINRRLQNRRGEATVLNNMGLAYMALGNVVEASRYLGEALEIYRAFGDRRAEGKTLNNIGGLYQTFGDQEKALDFFNRALILRREAGDRYGEGRTLANLGVLYRSRGDNSKALEYLNQGLSISKEIEDHQEEAWNLRIIGSIYSVLGEQEKALDSCEQSLSLSRTLGDRDSEAATLNTLGKIYELLRKTDEALASFDRALVLFQEDKRPLEEGGTLAIMMDYWEQAQNPNLAIFFGKEAINKFQQIRKNVHNLDAETERSFVESNAKAYRQLADLLISRGRLSEAEEVLDLLKEQEYFEFIRGDARSADSLTKPVALTPAEEKTYEDYKKISDAVTAIDGEWSNLRAKPSRTPDEEQRFSELTEKLKVANERMELYFRDLYNAFASGESEKKNVEQVREETSGLRSLTSDLGAGTVALYTLVTETKYRVIVITPNAMQPREYVISQVELRRKVAALRAALGNPQSDPLPASQDLYKILIAPIEKDLRGAKAKTLMWSLDDVLRYVPISALSDGKQYMVENYRNVVFTPASIGRLKDQPGARSDRGLGMGVSKDYDGLGPLPQVPDELRGIIHDDAVEGARGVIPGKVMLDDSFTEKNMEKALEQRQSLVHIASHFVLQPGNEADSYLLLGGKDEGGKGYHLTLAELRNNPRLTFSDTDLLTLSACQTATSSSAADGREVDSLGMMAQHRGAKAVMATLWSVEDKSTALLMADFYSRWIEHPDVNKAEALRQAQVAVLRGKQQIASSGPSDPPATQAHNTSQGQFSHPYFWAPFILIGNWQ